MLRTLAAVLIAAATTFPSPVASQSPALPTPAFHHLHLNSLNPAAAVDFYTRQFPSTSRAAFAGQPALKSPTDVWVLFTKVETPPATAPQTAFWHFGWHVTDVHKSLDRFRLHAITLLPLYTEEAGGTVFTSADTPVPSYRGGSVHVSDGLPLRDVRVGLPKAPRCTLDP